jgi:hypothetical protein
MLSGSWISRMQWQRLTFYTDYKFVRNVSGYRFLKNFFTYLIILIVICQKWHVIMDYSVTWEHFKMIYYRVTMNTGEFYHVM